MGGEGGIFSSTRTSKKSSALPVSKPRATSQAMQESPITGVALKHMNKEGGEENIAMNVKPAKSGMEEARKGGLSAKNTGGGVSECQICNEKSDQCRWAKHVRVNGMKVPDGPVCYECMQYKEGAHPDKTIHKCILLRQDPQKGADFKAGWLTGRRVRAGLEKLACRRGQASHGDRYGAQLVEKIPFLPRTFVEGSDGLNAPCLETLYGFGVQNVTLHDWKGTPVKGLLCPNWSGPCTMWLDPNR